MYDKKTIDAFLKNQLKLFPVPVADDEQEAAEFLEDVCATVCKNKKEVFEYLEDALDVSGMTEEEMLSAEEVFDIGDGRYLIVEG
ncbi:MAG: glyoxalase [Pseudobutyrivibrio sp.]|nr:glyoxalase [Pseudobutyrivibrio sp.]